MAEDIKGRPQQRLRTRKDLLSAASRLMRQGGRPSLEDVAAEAMVSRATAYRYFPDIGALLAEASIDVGVPDAEELFAKDASQDPVARLEKVDKALHDAVTEHEPQMRRMLAHAVTRCIDAPDDATPPRQNRRLPLIGAALAPARKQFNSVALRRLEYALAMIFGTEGVIVAKDVLRIDDAEARRVKRWAIRALVDAARKPVRGE
ncbi:MAG TPA: helix-turn-helix domain-containing protein [Steroidobacteraceae bacterium]|nr:helix-turn-helix domain-containing protein [Steroidobacteraceae bacterium]